MRSEPFHSGGTAGKHAKLLVDSSNSPGCLFVPISDLFLLPYPPPELSCRGSQPSCSPRSSGSRLQPYLLSHKPSQGLCAVR